MGAGDSPLELQGIAGSRARRLRPGVPRGSLVRRWSKAPTGAVAFTAVSRGIAILFVGAARLPWLLHLTQPVNGLVTLFHHAVMADRLRVIPPGATAIIEPATT